jgi:hypothetical protein
MKYKFLLPCIFGLLVFSTVTATTTEDSTVSSSLDVKSQNKIFGSDSIKGEVKINGEPYTAICDCSDADLTDEQKAFGPQCDPSKFKISQDKNGTGAGFNEVRDLIGYPTELEYANVDNQYFSCLDGRVKQPMLGTPGGDAGEFILGLAMYKDVIGADRELTQADVDSYFKQYLQYMKAEFFYMCTDDSALNHLEEEISVTGLNLRSPKKQVQLDTLEALVEPDNNGDLHIKMLLRYPDMYGIDVELVKMFLRAFYKVLWDQSNPYSQKLILDILIGTHTESAFLEVRSNQGCTAAKQAPLIRPNEPVKDGLSIFVNHLDAASIKRVEIAKFFSEYINKQKGGVSPETFHARMDHHALAYLEVTGTFLAKNLPFYSINIL